MPSLPKNKKTKPPTPKAFKSTQIISLNGCQIKHWDDLTTNQLKLAMLSASKVQKTDTHEKEYSMTFAEFAALCGFDEDTAGGKDYEKVYREAKALARKGVDYVTQSGDIIIFNWMDHVTIKPGSGTITYSLDPRLLPYYTSAAGTFAIIKLLDYMPLRGKYALMLYEYLSRWVNKGSVRLTIQQLREHLRVPETKFKRPWDFIRWVLNPALEEINEKAKHSFKIETSEEKGKKKTIEAITFILKPIIPLAEPDSPIKKDLMGYGVTAPIAEVLEEKHSPELIRGNISWVLQQRKKGLEIKSLPGFIIWAIENDKGGIGPGLFEAAAFVVPPSAAKSPPPPECPLCHGGKIIKDAKAESGFRLCECATPPSKYDPEKDPDINPDAKWKCTGEGAEIAAAIADGFALKK